jgi:hypothetical protein
VTACIAVRSVKLYQRRFDVEKVKILVLKRGVFLKLLEIESRQKNKCSILLLKACKVLFSLYLM